jgi:hypothetical protein
MRPTAFVSANRCVGLFRVGRRELKLQGAHKCGGRIRGRRRERELDKFYCVLLHIKFNCGGSTLVWDFELSKVVETGDPMQGTPVKVLCDCSCVLCRWYSNDSSRN